MSFFHNHVPKEERSKKVHSMSSPWRVPFSWEEEPGISKMHHPPQSLLDIHLVTSKVVVGQVPNCHKLPPPPPCALQPREPTKKLSRKTMKKKESDPFMAALMECTKSGGHHKDNNKGGGSASARRKFGSLSCKQSCGVSEDNLVRFQYDGRHLPFCSPPLNGSISAVMFRAKSQKEQNLRR